MNTFWFIFFLSLLVLQRLSELWISKRHEIYLKKHGALEFGQGHYPWIILLMIFFLISLPLEFFGRKTQNPSYWPLLLLFILLTQALRFWSIKSLGKRWTTRIWILPNTSRITQGPYRFCKHPNYLAVTLELILIPWLFGCYYTMPIFTLLYLGWLKLRLKEENHYLKPNTGI